MKFPFIVLFLVASTFLYADNPPYLAKAKGVLFNGLGGKADLTLSPGTLEKCTESGDDALKGSRCSLKDASAISVAADGTTGLFQFDSVGVLVRKADTGYVRQYRFFGVWTQKLGDVSASSDVLFDVVSKDSSEPMRLKGWVRISEYGIIQGMDLRQISALD